MMRTMRRRHSSASPATAVLPSRTLRSGAGSVSTARSIPSYAWRISQASCSALRPLHLLVGAQASPLRSRAAPTRRHRGLDDAEHDRREAWSPTNGPACRQRRASCPARRSAERGSPRTPCRGSGWRSCRDRPRARRASCRASRPRERRARRGRTSPARSPSGRAVVSMNEVTPGAASEVLLPREQPGSRRPAGPRDRLGAGHVAAAARLRGDRPEPRALARHARHDARAARAQAARCGSGTSGVASQNDSTAGCIDATSATEESPRARVRSISPTGLVDFARLSNSPPSASGTPVSRKPAGGAARRSPAGSRASRRWRSCRSAAKRSAMPRT